jgi:outer membrane protein assembly factor BamE
MTVHSFSLLIRRLAPAAMLAALAAALLAVSACVYRPTIQQGNLLKTEDVDQVTEGMTRTQVRYLLGTPMINDPFDPQRWDYVYRLTTGRKRNTVDAHFIVYFEGDNVSRVEKVAVPGSYVPTDNEQQAIRNQTQAAESALESTREPPPPPSIEPARPDAGRPGN